MSEAPPVIGPTSSQASGAPISGLLGQRSLEVKRRGLVARMAKIGASAQAVIPGLYAWAITVAPAAWSRGAPIVAKVVASMGLLALVTAPIFEGAAHQGRNKDPGSQGARSPKGTSWARAWSVWGFVLSSAAVWALAPVGLSSARMDAVRGVLGIVGWGLFAFASAGPALESDPNLGVRIVASPTLRPRSMILRGDALYVGIGALLALSMQMVGWGIVALERAILVRLATLICGIAILSGSTSIALARHGNRSRASRRTAVRRALPWLVILSLFLVSGGLVGWLR